MSSFLPNDLNRRLLPGFAVFMMAAVGVALGFLANRLNSRLLEVFAFIVTALGVLLGFAVIARSWWRVASGHAQMDQEQTEVDRRRKQPWE